MQEPPARAAPHLTLGHQASPPRSTCRSGLWCKSPDSWPHRLGPHLGDTFLGKGSRPTSQAGKHLDLQDHTRLTPGRLLRGPLPPAALRTTSGGRTPAPAGAPDSPVAPGGGSQAEGGLVCAGRGARELEPEVGGDGGEPSARAMRWRGVGPSPQGSRSGAHRWLRVEASPGDAGRARAGSGRDTAAPSPAPRAAPRPPLPPRPYQPVGRRGRGWGRP